VTSVESEALNTATRLKKAGKNGRLSMNLIKMMTWFKQLLVQQLMNSTQIMLQY